MGVDGEIIIDGQDITIEPDGTIYSGGQPTERIKIVDFEKKELLQPVGISLFEFTGEGSGVIPAEEYSVRQGFYEASNVDIMKEMVDPSTFYEVSRHTTRQRKCRRYHETSNRSDREIVVWSLPRNTYSVLASIGLADGKSLWQLAPL